MLASAIFLLSALQYQQQYINATQATYDATKLEGICVDVYRQRRDRTNPSVWTYTYERKIFEAAGVNTNEDSQQVAREKIRLLWDAKPKQLFCDSLDFPVSNGSILKYAIETRTFNLIDNASRFWGVDLNWVDAADGETLLDYLSNRVDENPKDSPMYRRLSGYYSDLRRYGARHCNELSDLTVCSSKALTRSKPVAEQK